MASPVIGGGVAAPRFHQLFWLSRQNGGKTAEDWARFTWSVLQAQNEALLKDGAPLQGEDNLIELRRQAEAWGAIWKVVDDDALQAEAMQTARQLAALPPTAVSELRRLVQAPSYEALQDHLTREREAFLRCAASAEFAQRVAAFAGRAAR